MADYIKNVKWEKDDYFLFGDIVTDRSKYLYDNFTNYTCEKFVQFKFSDDVVFESDWMNNKRILKMDSKCIEPNNEFVHLYNELYRESKERKLRLTIDLNSLDREFLLLLSTVLFKGLANVSFKFIYFSSERYNEDMWAEIRHEPPRILSLAPGTPQFGCSALIIIAGYETNAVKELVKKYQPDTLIIGYNRKGVSEKAEIHNKKLISDILDYYKYMSNIHIVKFECDVRNPDQCCVDLKRVLQDNKIMINDTFVQHAKLAVMNTRLSLIGAMLFASRYRDLQIVYAKPSNFDEDQLSVGVNEYFEYKIEGE